MTSFARTGVASWITEALAHGDTYRGLAHRAGVHERTLRRIVNGKPGGSLRWRGERVRIDVADRLALATHHELWELTEVPYHGAVAS